MVQINFEQAKEFLEDIEPKDKIAIIHHDDSDGFASGVIYFDFCKNKKVIPKQFAYSYGKSSFDKFNLKKFNKIIICDVGPNESLIADLETIKDKKVFYTDHHPNEFKTPKEILEFRTTDQGYIPSSRTAYELTGIKSWLSLAGSISDAADLYPENYKFIEELLKKENKTLEEFKEKVSSVISNFLTYFNHRFDEAFKILEKIDSVNAIDQLTKYSEPVENEIKKYVKDYEKNKEMLGEINFYLLEPKLSVKGTVIGILSRKYPEEILIFGTPKEDNQISLSARNQSAIRSMPELLKEGIKNLKGATAGGHPRAGGAKINKRDLGKFKENLRIFVESNPIK